MAACNLLCILTSLSTKPEDGELGKYHSLPALDNHQRIVSERLPSSIRIILESAIKNCDECQTNGKDSKKVPDWGNTATKHIEIPFKPASVIRKDFTGVPTVVDLASMRDAMNKLNCDPDKINPLVPIDLVFSETIAGGESMGRSKGMRSAAFLFKKQSLLFLIEWSGYTEVHLLA